jgi:hypothetical protein
MAGMAAGGAGEAPSGTSFEHKVIAIDGPGLIRINYCGLPVQVALAGVSYKAPEWEQKGLDYLKQALRPGQIIRLDLDLASAPENAFPAPAYILSEGKNCNVELVRQGIAVTDARSKQYGQTLQTAMMQATERKAGFWGAKPVTSTTVASAPTKPATPTAVASVKPAEPQERKAPPGYNGVVVADLNGGEYFYPQSKLAQTIRSGARIEYTNPQAAERANPRPKRPNPYDFPDLFEKWQAQQLAQQKITLPDPAKAVVVAQQTLKDAMNLMQEGYKDRSKFQQNLKQAEKLLAAQLQLVEPLAETRPNDNAVQKVAEELAMQLYQARKNQSL